MADTTTLGEFLRLRRGRLKPQDVGIASYGERRVPGLRREELAQLAGVSVTYYTRLEQGQSHQASESVIEALARALELSDDERLYLHNLARPRTARPRTPAPATVRRATRQLINSLQWPAVVTGPRTEVLAWNSPGYRLLAGHLDRDAPDHADRRPNLTRMLFLDPHHRDLYPRWDTSASCAVASLRLTVSRRPDDPELAALIGELTMKSEEFTTLWSAHPVAEHASGPRHLRHPEIGELDLELETLLLADEPDQRLLIYSAADGSPSQAALRLLWV
ncbi:helix-turn-helix transcriptional regulator [Nonomuraea aurantiaca]|uniref:helix-turn-helix transcriptional regulator n=1 Tax=Nonomuraea aurantiaca TaxID=2878562 RepID=UPI001CD93C01|nr:helix-turn-helix transcriptional regulator [Nonomuraea aurantiaca]MCA2230147.1 helix-turn-helix transcriptional regulator [Nonomuraea aurantiaca]